jgi:diguanylate cyclase (GGDEF)-like protein/putative nucleotidyltransferase with HDIG domain
VHRLSEAVLRARTAADVTGRFVLALREGLQLGQVHLSQVSQGGDVGQATIAAGDGGERRGYTQVLDDRPSGVAWVVATGEPLIVRDARRSRSVRRDLVERFDVASMAYVPVSWGGDVRYVAILISHEPRDFGGEAVAFAQTLANQAAGALAVLEAEQRRAARAERDAALTRAAAALNASLELVEVLETLAREAGLAMGGALAGVYLADGEGGGVATAGHNVDPSWAGIRLCRGEGVAGRVLTTGAPYVTNAYQTAIESPHESLGAIKTAAGVPMVWNGELKGALSVGFTEMRRVTEEDLRALQAIAALAVAACRNAEAYEHARVEATTDALTGLINHGALQLRVREEISRARRGGTPLACLLLDLDDFKAVNDDRGHQAGDEQLRLVAAALRAELRDHDVVARYGGDEFVVLLPGADAGGGRLVADRIAAAVPVACSIGVADWTEPLSADELLERADRALLHAKRTGKRRVAVAGREAELAPRESGSPAAVRALAAAIEARDDYTHHHSEQVVSLATDVARLLGLTPAEVDAVRHAALLHDVGKLAIPDEILHKPGPLTDAEWRVMAQHPVIGERILRRTPQLGHLAPIVRHEHERWDGRGYPDGLAGTEIPIASRIILACDAYNAMITTRPYREAMSARDAVAELRDKSGTQFDPRVVAALLKRLRVPLSASAASAS